MEPEVAITFIRATATMSHIGFAHGVSLHHCEAAEGSRGSAGRPTTRSGTKSGERTKAMTVKTFLFACATNGGPKLLAFRTSNLLIGRMPDNHLSLNHGSVSRRHAAVAVTAKGVFIEDLKSQNGTTLNGAPVKEKTAIRPGDIIRIGHVPLFYFGFVQPGSPPSVEFIESAVQVTPSLPPL